MLPVSAELPLDMRKALMNVYRPGFVLLPKELRQTCPAMDAVCEIRDYILLRTNYTRRFPVHPQLGLLITTSGSTGSAKFVRQSWDNLRFNASAIADFLQIDSFRTGPSPACPCNTPMACRCCTRTCFGARPWS